MLTQALKHEELYDQLWDELVKLSPGDKFLSIRDIMRRYEVSQLTVDKAVTRLREEGYLRNSAGKGLFASEQVKRFSQNQPPTYLLAVPQWESIDIDVLEQTAARIATEYPDRRLLVHKFDISCTVPSSLPIQEENVEGIILLTTSNNLTLKDMATINAYQRPVVLLGYHLKGQSITSIGSDDTFAGNLAADYLEKHGHRHIAVLLSEPHNDIIMARVKAICDYAELRGIKTEIIDCEVKSGEVATDKAYRKFSAILQDGFKFTAVAGISGDSMQGVVNACHNSQIRIPEDLSLIAIGAERLTETFFPPITTVALDFGNQVVTALQLLDKKVKNELNANHAIYQRPYIIEQKSVKII